MDTTMEHPMDNAAAASNTPTHADSADPPVVPTGPVRSTISGGYRFRLLLIGVGLLGFGGWALYDGMVAYPKKQKMWQAFQAYQAEHDDWQTGWPQYASENGYTENYNKIKELNDMDITTQFIMAGICLPIGAWFAFGWLTAGGRWVEGDERGVRNNKGVDLTWDQVKELEDQRWKSKGIAYLRYDADGSDKRLLLDDWKFDREATGAIYKIAASKLKPEETPVADESATS